MDKSIQREHNYACDLYRFLLSIGVMAVHIRWVGVSSPVYWWIYVEGFFIITGSLMAKRFDVEKQSFANFSIDECATMAIKYTWNKLYKLLKYIVPVLLLEYFMQFAVMIADGFKLEKIVTLLLKFSTEVSMLTVFADESGRYLGTLWYMSAMLIVLPLLCFLLLRFRKFFTYIVSWIFVIVYIAVDGIQTLAWGMIAIKRAFCFISLGVASYYLGKRITEYCDDKIKKGIFTMIELLSHCYIFVALSFDFATSRFHYILAFFLGITIMLSGCSYSQCLKGDFIKYLGELSAPMFVSQMFIGDFIKYTCDYLGYNYSIEFSNTIRVAMYFLLTIMFSVLLKYAADLWHIWHITKHKRIEV